MADVVLQNSRGRQRADVNSRTHTYTVSSCTLHLNFTFTDHTALVAVIRPGTCPTEVQPLLRVKCALKVLRKVASGSQYQ